MIKIDLITGFLGSGKTTFIRNYAQYYINKKIKVGIIENDFGAINVDALLLRDLECDYCGVEQIVGGNVVTDWKRRFKAKLIAMAMEGYQRILLEPSGIYDVETFFDVLYDEPLDRWYEAGTVAAIVEAESSRTMTAEEEYLLMSQVSNASKTIFSKTDQVHQDAIEKKTKELNDLLEKYQCSRRLSVEKDVMWKNWVQWGDEDYKNLSLAGWRRADHKKLWFDKDDTFETEFFMDYEIGRKNIEMLIKSVFSESKCGNIARVKGFLSAENQRWIQFNATKNQYHEKESHYGQKVFIVIGQNLDREQIENILCDRSS